MDGSSDNNLSKITAKLGEHEFRIVRLENSIENLTNDVRNLTKIVERNHQSIKYLKDMYERYARDMNDSFNKLLNGVLKSEKRQQKMIDKTLDYFWKIALIFTLALSGLKVGGII